MDREEIDEVWAEYQDVVNMTAGELERWAETPCSRLASLDRAPIRRNLRLLQTPKEEWGEREVRDARRTISFVRRMSAGEQGKPVSDECPYSRRDISLMNWAFDPRKGVRKSGMHVVISAPLPPDITAALEPFAPVGDVVLWTGRLRHERAVDVVIRDFVPDPDAGATVVGVGYLDGSGDLIAMTAVFGMLDLYCWLQHVGDQSAGSIAGIVLRGVRPGPLPDLGHLTWTFDAVEARIDGRLVARRELR